jgi:2-amino-4,5-dihydroxy-6-oxo-7-(phosphonooxy)heptanoate synthase
VSAVCAGGADAVVVHKGRARLIDPELLVDSALIVHLSASTAHAPDSNAKVLVGDVEEALRLGADAVSVHVNIGSDTEAAQLVDLGTVAGACDRWGVPLLAMVYPRGPRVATPSRPELVAHVVNIAADLGADIVKTVAAAPVARMADVVTSSPIPVVVAGGPGTQTSLYDFAVQALAVGCRGLAAGRRVFGSTDPEQAVRKLAAIVHGTELPPESAPQQQLAGAL